MYSRRPYGVTTYSRFTGSAKIAHPVVVTGHVGGGSRSHTFTRKRWRELKAEIAEREIAAPKPKKVAAVVAKSDAVAERAIEAIERVPFEIPNLAPVIEQLRQAVEQTAAAHKLEQARQYAKQVAEIAEMIHRELAAQQDEEEALLLLAA